MHAALTEKVMNEAASSSHALRAEGRGAAPVCLVSGFSVLLIIHATPHPAPRCARRHPLPQGERVWSAVRATANLLPLREKVAERSVSEARSDEGSLADRMRSEEHT